MKTTDRIVGAFEKVSFPDFGVSNIVAKVDTGAYSGALHATDMREKITKKGNKILTFHPLGKPMLKSKTSDYIKKKVRSSNGHLEERFVIFTIVEIDGKRYKIEISLSDRSSMMKGVLLGRKFLSRYHFLVDVQKGKKYRYDIKD